MASGTVYKITNNVTDKCYIGQTVSSIGRRWSQHVYNANSVARKCRFLENSIRKYGAENFTIVAIAKFRVEDLDSVETKFIEDHNSTDRKCGYNICKGGNGSRGRPVDEDHRKKISKANRKCTLDVINLQERKLKGKLVGYGVSKNINNVRYTKNFANTKNSIEKNLELAQKWLNDVDSGQTQDTNRYNRIHKLPRNISYNYNNSKNLVGYNVKIEYKGKRYIKAFTFQNLSMDEKLKLAIEYKEHLLDSLRKNEEDSRKLEQVNQQPSP